MIRENELNKQKLHETLKANPLDRNKQLNTFLGLLNTIERSSILAIDGEWGSGKTFFVKQVEYLNKEEINTIPSLDHTIISNFKKKYEVYYFNAWENDYHEDPLQSILLNLINDIWGRRESAGDAIVKYSKAFKSSILKTTTLGLYDPQEVRESENITDLAKSIITTTERKKAVDDIINNHIDLKGKKLLFIIDELDRCKPTYAVNLLEVIKHYFNNDNIVFLLSTNNLQLSHTIKKVYGQSFDGGGYLNRFYDLIFNLPLIKRDKYIEYLGSNPRNGYWKDRAPFEVATYLDMSMRQINRYYSSLKLIEAFFDSTDNFTDRDSSVQLVKFVMIPLAYGLRITNIDEYKKFVSGEGESILSDFYDNSETLETILEINRRTEENIEPKAVLSGIYKKLFEANAHHSREEYHIRVSAETFSEVVLLMNASGIIDEEPTIEGPEAKQQVS